MTRVRFLTALAAVILAQSAPAADEARFLWEKGQIHTYKVEQSTTVTELTRDADTDAESRTQTITKLGLTKSWTVTDVDAKGVATLVMSVSALRMESVKADGKSEIFDSTKPDPAHPETQAEMAKYLNQPLTTVRINPLGQLVEVKESKFGPATRLEADLPFKLTLPTGPLTEGQPWERSYTITLDRTGEKFDATQQYSVQGVTNGVTVIALKTVLKAVPDVVSEQIPLLAFQPEGSVYFHPATGRYLGAQLKISKELTNHQGRGSKYIFTSSYAENPADVK